jgi:flagellar protein FlgJ
MTQDASLAAKQAQDSELLSLQRQMDRLKGDLSPKQGAQQKLRKACNDFEAVFMSKMWEEMRATIPKSGFMHSPQEDMYRSMFDRDFSEKLASDGGIGLGDMLYKQLKDKLKTTKTITGTTGLDTPAAAKAQADANAGAGSGSMAAPSRVGAIDPTTTTGIAPTGGAVSRTAFKAPSRGRNGVNTSLAASSSGRSYGMEPAAAASITSPRAQGSLGSSSPAAATGGPKVPASVAGDVMPDVEALADRIVADYEHKLRVNGLQPDQETYRAPDAQQGQGASGYNSGGYARKGYGADSSSGTGRKLATIG